MIEKIHPILGIAVRDNGEIFANGHWTRGNPDCQYGYLKVTINRNQYRVHRLVAETFLPNPDNKPTVDHINRIRDDNRVDNLRWATHREQRDNSSQVLDAKDYGVRSCEDKKQWMHEYHKTYTKAYNDKKRQTHRSVRFGDGITRFIPFAEAEVLLKLPVKERIYQN